MKRKERKAIALLGENIIWSRNKGERLAIDDEVLGATVEFCCKLNSYIRSRYRRYFMVINNIDDYRILFQANQIREIRKRIRFEIFCYNREIFESLQLKYPLFHHSIRKTKLHFA